MNIKRLTVQLNLDNPKHKIVFDHIESIKKNGDDKSSYLRNVLYREAIQNESTKPDEKEENTQYNYNNIDGIV